MTTPVRQLLVAAAVGLTGMLLAGRSLAQEGPIVVGQREKPPVFSLYNYNAYADVIWRQRRESIDPAGAPKEKFIENRFEETFTLEAQGHIYHPNLVELDLSGTFGLTQTDISGTVPDERQDGFLTEYDVSATFLRKETAPVTIYSRRTQDQVNREFGPTLDNTYMTTGAIWDIRSKTIPTRFEVFHSEQEQTGLGEDIGDFKLVQDSFLWHSESRPYVGHLITWDYMLSNVTEETQGFASNNYLLNDANLSYSIDFGPADRHNFTSSVSYFNQGGDFPLERFRWSEFLRLRHTDSFETRYQVVYDHQEFSGLEQDRYRGVAGFTHYLYKSLVTSANVGAEQIYYSDDSESLDIFGNINFDYRKRVPLGQFSAFLGVASDWQRNQDQVQPTPVIDQARTFVDPAPIVLIGNNIDPNSIVITDTTRIIVYQLGLDYTITALPGQVQIDRVVGGRISNGQTVLIDYLLLPQADNTVTTNTFSIGGRYDIDDGLFKGLAIYTRFTQQDQDIESDDPGGFTPNSFTDIVIGAEYQVGDFTFGAEYESYDSTISPFDANRFFASYGRRLSEATTVSVNATYTMLQYPDTDNEVDLLTVAASVQHRLSRRAWMSATVVWRDEQDEQRGDTTGFEEQLQINWYHRQTTVYGLIRNSNLNTPFQDNSFQTFEIGIRREF